MSNDGGTREAILKAARSLLEERGAAKVRMADVARAAGLSRQAVYLHFGSRAGLLVALVEYVDEVEEIRPLLDWVFAAETGAELLGRAMEMQARYTPKIAPVADAIEAAARSDEAAAAAWSNRMESRLRGCRELVRRLAESGELKPELDEGKAADLLWTLISVALWRMLVRERGWTAEEYSEHLTKMSRAVLLR